MVAIVKSSSLKAALAAGLILICSQKKSCASSTYTPLSFISSTNGRNRLSLFARKQQKSSPAKRPPSASGSSTVIEEVKPLMSVSEERRLSALEALTQQQREKDKRYDSPLFADMDAAAMLLETFTQATNDDGSPANLPDTNKQPGVAQKRMGSVPGATSMTMLRQQAADEGGYALNPRDSKHLYREDGSNQARWAVGSLIEKLDEKIKERSDAYGEMVEDEDNASTMSDTPVPKKRKRGRPRKHPLKEEQGASSSLDTVVKVDPIQPRNSQIKDKRKKVKVSNIPSAKVTGGTLMRFWRP